MAEFPALPLFTDAYLGDTTHLTTIEHGAYLLLLMVAWRSKDCRLPDDDRLLARYSKTTPAQWRRLKPILEPFFLVENGHWIQRRLNDEHDHVRQVRESQAANGRASALKRKGRHSTKRMPSVNGASTPTPSPSPTEEVSEPNGSLVNVLRPEHVVEAWNAMAERLGLATVRKLSTERRRKLQIRIREHTIEDFTEAISAIERSPFLRGDGKEGWRADFDFLLQPKSFLKLIEGSYDRAH